MGKFENLADLLPHRGPMLLLDTVADWGESFLEAVVEHRAPNIFADKNGHIPTWVGIEYMAQAIAAWVGIQSRLRGEEIRLGFLLGTRQYVTNREYFEVGEKLHVRVEKLLLDENNLALFDCRIHAHNNNNNLLASAQIKAIQPDNVEEMLRENQLS